MSYSARQNAQYKSPKKGNHIVQGGHGYRPPLRNAIKRCDKCAGLPWQRKVSPCPGKIGDQICGGLYADEVMPTASDFAAVGSAGLQAMQATGYARFNGSSGGRTR